MKRIVTITLLVLILVAQSGCKKRLIDYRNKYVGNYALTVNYTWYDENQEIQSEQIIYKGKVYYERKKHDKGMLVVVYADGQERMIKIDRKGKSDDPDTSGTFADRDNFTISFTTSPTPLSGYDIKVVGTRI